jgi:hypothetical protein
VVSSPEFAVQAASEVAASRARLSRRISAAPG